MRLSVTDNRRLANVVTTLATHSAEPRVPFFSPYLISTSPLIYYWTEPRQHEMCFFNVTMQEFIGLQEAILAWIKCWSLFSSRIWHKFNKKITHGGLYIQSSFIFYLLALNFLTGEPRKLQQRVRFFFFVLQTRLHKWSDIKHHSHQVNPNSIYLMLTKPSFYQIITLVKLEDWWQWNPIPLVLDTSSCR